MKTIDISGMGGGYEHACQLMLQAAEEFLKHTPVIAKEFDRLGYGETDNARMLTKVMVKAANNDCTGAMMGATLAHALYISAHGRQAWMTEVAGNDPDRIYEWDGTVNSVPSSAAGMVASAMVGAAPDVLQ